MLAFAAIGAALLSAMALIARHAPDHLPAIELFVGAVRAWAVLAQLLVVIICWLRWPQIVNRLVARGRISCESAEPLRRARHRLAALAFAITLTLGAGLPVWPLTLLHAA